MGALGEGGGEGLSLRGVGFCHPVCFCLLLWVCWFRWLMVGSRLYIDFMGFRLYVIFLCGYFWLKPYTLSLNTP